jgi:hypothetical protein
MSVGFAAKYPLYPGNDNVLTLTGLSDLLTGQFQNGAVVTATLYDQFSNPVPGASNIVMNYVAASNGNYQGIIPGITFNPIPLPPGTNPTGGYKLVVTAVSGAIQSIWQWLVELVPRTQ